MAQSRRMLLIIDAQLGPIKVEVETDEAASSISAHHHALLRYLAGDDDDLKPFRRVQWRIGGQVYRPETRPARIEDLAQAGELDYDDIYVLE